MEERRCIFAPQQTSRSLGMGQDLGIGRDRREWLGRAHHEHLPVTPARAHAVERRHARGLRRCDLSAVYAGFRSSAGACRSGDRRHPRRVQPLRSPQPARPKAFDLGALAEAATRSGNLAIPLVKALTASVARADAEAARYVHWGATSQDVIDTAAMLTLAGGDRRAAAGSRSRHRRLCQTGKATSRTPPWSARTWLQHALPMPFGLKLAEYAAALHRSRIRLQRMRKRDAGAAVRRRRGDAGSARRQRMARCRETRRRNLSCRCRKRRGTPIATAWRRRLRCWPSSRAPAARSPAMCR